MKKKIKYRSNEKPLMAMFVLFGVLALVGGYVNYVSKITGEDVWGSYFSGETNVLGVKTKKVPTPVPRWPCKVCNKNAKGKCVSVKYTPCDAKRQPMGLGGCSARSCGW